MRNVSRGPNAFEYLLSYKTIIIKKPENKQLRVKGNKKIKNINRLLVYDTPVMKINQTTPRTSNSSIWLETKWKFLLPECLYYTFQWE